MQQALREEVAPAPPSTDRRSVRTRLALRDALAAEIIATGDLSQVTVTAVTDRAGVTRRTFYSHYRDIPDLVNQIEDETTAEIQPYLQGLVAVDLAGLERALNDCEPCPGAAELLGYFKERSSYLAPLLGEGGDPAFRNKLTAAAHDVVYARAADGLALGVAQELLEYYLSFALSAEVGVLVRWLTTGMHESVDVMARLATGLMFVRPGDLYNHRIDFNVPAFGLTLLALKEKNND
jgi:AcrR family transcriptional regulator